MPSSIVIQGNRRFVRMPTWLKQLLQVTTLQRMFWFLYIHPLAFRSYTQLYRAGCADHATETKSNECCPCRNISTYWYFVKFARLVVLGFCGMWFTQIPGLAITLTYFTLILSLVLQLIINPFKDSEKSEASEPEEYGKEVGGVAENGGEVIEVSSKNCDDVRKAKDDQFRNEYRTLWMKSNRGSVKAREISQRAVLRRLVDGALCFLFVRACDKTHAVDPNLDEVSSLLNTLLLFTVALIPMPMEVKNLIQCLLVTIQLINIFMNELKYMMACVCCCCVVRKEFDASQSKTKVAAVDHVKLSTQMRVTSVSFSPDGKLVVSGSLDMTLLLLDSLSRKCVLKPMKGHTDAVLSVSFSL